MKKSVLVVAQRTVTSAALEDFLRRENEVGPVEFTLLIPDGAQALRDPAMTAAVGRMRGTGLVHDVRVGDRDPLQAVFDHWNPARFDQIVVSTLPAASSRWLAGALPRRIERLTGALVTHVTADDPRGLVARGV